MRELKFRAFFENRMVPVSILYFPHHYANSSEVEGNLGICPIMQFTGLKDKNGKDIYEGDVLHINNYTTGFYHKVIWHDEGYFCCTDMIESYKTDFVPGAHCEVIGNIYENKDILEVGIKLN